jgi:SAM-dependent methyltransferase
MDDWETYWNHISVEDKGGVFWDDVSDADAEEDLQRFIHHMDPDLPLLDLGCGHGRQTRFFARHFKKVIGADISLSAVRLAKSETINERNVEYRVFDALNSESACALHQEFGDMNIYMRGVLHMIKWHDRRKFTANLALLLGEKGTLYQIELPTKSILYMRSLPQELFSTIPKITRRVGFNNEDRRLFYPDDQWIIAAEGGNVSLTTIPLPEGQKDMMPANFLILRNRCHANPDSRENIQGRTNEY